MGVQLNIKDENVVRLARKLAKAEHKSVTQVLRDLLEREERAREEAAEAKTKAVLEIVERMRALMSPEDRAKSSKEWMDEIYDEDGLPI
ncbi:PSK operon transcription factor [Sphingomonas sp. MAH-20]|jgi:antitoxin VapB|uniref:PSK operon transcription factor n=1 Tax=Sphingomonas horti TaxID=2682842 RepID=A0A6I4J374_9SPHN|nr:MULTISPECIES: type II toxin-antitoxin system VapB family antitoxin [Sphingomonas]MBA2918663.1 type II toxin-antitoxin system VapB family antitoxin [Sphingomonas sp. CGMCC 1.13658]MVO78694.1 PSK operon transcription factor [Sphingomonas horti]